MKKKWLQMGIFFLWASLILAGCAGGFETVEEEAYRTERMEGVVVKSTRETQTKTGAPAPTSTPIPSLKERYEIPETSVFTFESGKLTVEGTVEVVAPEGNAMAAYALSPGGFSREKGNAIFAACGDTGIEKGTFFQTSNLPLWEEGEAQWSLAGDMAQVLFYRNKGELENVSGLQYNYERSGAEPVEGSEAEELRQQGEAFLEKAELGETFCVGRMSKMELEKGDTLYLIDFQRLVEGIPVMENFGFSDIIEGHDIWPLEGMRLGIDGEGVCFFCWEAPFAVGEEVKLGEMLPFPVIQQTMIALLKGEHERENRECRLEVSRLELCYRPQYTEEKGAVLVPVWNLLGTQNGSEGERTLLSVNALTGEEMSYRSWRGKR